MCENKASRGHGRIWSGRSRLDACSCTAQDQQAARTKFRPTFKLTLTRRHHGDPSYSYRISRGVGGGPLLLAATAPEPKARGDWCPGSISLGSYI